MTGAFRFVVGDGSLPTSTNALVDNVQAPDSNFNGWSITSRWLNYLAMAAFVGGLAFLLLVWRPSLAQLQTTIRPELPIVKQRTANWASRFLLGSLLVLLLGWIAMWLYQTSVVSGNTLWQIFGSNAPFHLLVASHFGIIWLIRLALIVLAFLLWSVGHSKNVLVKRLSSAVPWGLILIGIAIMCTTSLDSHAGASRDAWFLLPTDLLHLVSTGFWIGGLLCLVGSVQVTWNVLVPGTGDRTSFLAELIPHFSLIAIISVIVLVITGVVQAIIQVGSFGALLTSSYGCALDIKLLLFAVLLCLGAYNLLRVSPRMGVFAGRSDDESGAKSVAAGKLQRIFRRSVRTEVIVMVLLLLVVGGLTSLSPPPQSISTPAASGGGPLLHQGQMADISYRFVINPGKIGENTMEIALTDKSGQPIQRTNAVITRFTMLDMDMGIQEVDLQPIANKPGHYAATASVVSMTGQWRITLLVRRTGFDDVETSFKYSFR